MIDSFIVVETNAFGGHNFMCGLIFNGLFGVCSVLGLTYTISSDTAIFS